MRVGGICFTHPLLLNIKSLVNVLCLRWVGSGDIRATRLSQGVNPKSNEQSLHSKLTTLAYTHSYTHSLTRGRLHFTPYPNTQTATHLHYTLSLTYFIAAMRSVLVGGREGGNTLNTKTA